MIKQEIICNNCERQRLNGQYKEEWFHYENQWGYFGVNDQRHDVIDLCHSCYTEIIDKFKIHPMVN